MRTTTPLNRKIAQSADQEFGIDKMRSSIKVYLESFVYVRGKELARMPGVVHIHQRTFLYLVTMVLNSQED